MAIDFSAPQATTPPPAKTGDAIVKKLFSVLYGLFFVAATAAVSTSAGDSSAAESTSQSDATTSPITQDPSDRITGGPIQSTPKPGGVPQLHVSLGAILLSVAVAYIV